MLYSLSRPPARPRLTRSVGPFFFFLLFRCPFHARNSSPPQLTRAPAAGPAVFRAELFAAIKEGRSTNDPVRIDAMEPQVFKALLCFVYTDSLTEMKQEEEATMCQHLLVAADTYDMERLKLICEHKLCKHIDVGTVANILALAEAHRCHVLRSACFAFLGRKANLTAVMASDGFEHLNASCPSLVKELLAMHSMT
jgi:speckle-type POZ protein